MHQTVLGLDLIVDSDQLDFLALVGTTSLANTGLACFSSVFEIPHSFILRIHAGVYFFGQGLVCVEVVVCRLEFGQDEVVAQVVLIVEYFHFFLTSKIILMEMILALVRSIFRTRWQILRLQPMRNCAPRITTLKALELSALPLHLRCNMSPVTPQPRSLLSNVGG